MSAAALSTLDIVARPHSRRPLSARAARRHGMSILEVMLATTMVLGCVMALSRVAFIAGKHATSAEDRSLAQIHCQNIMEELLAGLRPLEPVEPQLLFGEQWYYAIDVEPLVGSQLASIRVQVDRVDDDDAALPREDDFQGYQLVRWVRLGDRSLASVDAAGMWEDEELMDQDGDLWEPLPMDDEFSSEF